MTKQTQQLIEGQKQTEVFELLQAARNLLLSYRSGCGNSKLAQEIADEIEKVLPKKMTQHRELAEGQKTTVVMMYKSTPSTYLIAKHYGIAEKVVVAALKQAGGGTLMPTLTR